LQSAHLAALSAVTAERDRLLSEVERMAKVVGTQAVRNFVGQDAQREIDELVALGIEQDKREIEKLRAEVEGLRKDAARLDWLDGYIVIAEHEDTGKFAFNSIKEALRECVDATMAAKEG